MRLPPLLLLPLLAPFSLASRSGAALRSGIARFYDRSSPLWEAAWGDHCHHGHYPGGEPRSDHRQAQVDMISELLSFCRLGSPPRAILDVGCGLGGSSRHLASEFPGSSATGITLSPYQQARATQLSAGAGLGERTTFLVADALDSPFADCSFDLVWSLESGEHVPEKARFVAELLRVCEPGGAVMLCTWCHRDVPGGGSLGRRERRVLDKISR